MSVVVRHRCATPAAARALRAAVAADNPSYVTVELDGAELVVRLRTASLMSARATLDDLLACLSAAERSVGTATDDPPRAAAK